MEGVICVYKEPGWTSGDVVNKLKGVLHERRIGHGGTLDPDAEGVLPVCVGRATRLFDYLGAYSKQYAAKVVFGKTTDTQDGSGTVLSQRPVEFSLAELDETLKRFTGKILQTPPMYSALHVNGQRLYDLARQGKQVELEPREIMIYQLERVGAMEADTCSLRVRCGKGTYVRTLCHDIGAALGCGAYMAHLLREEAGNMKVADALTVAQIEEKVKQDKKDFITPCEQVLSFMPPVHLKEEAYKKIANGNPVEESYADVCIDENVNVRLYCGTKFFGIGERRGGFYCLKCMLGEST